MERKNNRGVLILLILFIILTLTLGGYIFWDKVLSNQINENMKDNQIENSNNTFNDIESIDNGEYKINDTEVDRGILSNLISMLGIYPTDNNCNSCLNYYLSNENYSNEAKNIISYYKDAYSLDLLKSPPDYVYSSVDCGMGAADCYSISKNDAETLFEIYNFKGNINDYFKISSNLKNDYLFFYNHSLGYCNISTDHIIDSEYFNDKDIRIIDKQVVTKYISYTQDIESTIERTVVFEFKLNDNSVYYLDKVNVN